MLILLASPFELVVVVAAAAAGAGAAIIIRSAVAATVLFAVAAAADSSAAVAAVGLAVGVVGAVVDLIVLSCRKIICMFYSSATVSIGKVCTCQSC